jgi:hypothetical protein
MTPVTNARVAAGVAAVASVALAVVQLRHGVLQLLDTGSYVSGARALRAGHPFTTTLAPSFSNFSVLDVLDRGGRLPFVDFPIGYPLLAGPVALAVGAKGSLALLVTLATGAMAAAIVLAPGVPEHRSTPWLRAAFAAALVCLPVYRLVVQGGLSEPLFCAVVVGLAGALVRYRRDGSAFGWACVLAGAAGLLRFVGGVVAVMPALEHYRRHRNAGRALLVFAGCVAPVALNVVLAGAAGGGHTTHWHGLGVQDWRLVGRSAAGWFSTRTGDLAQTLLKVGDALPWWAAVVAVVWALACVAALAMWIGLLAQRRTPDPLVVGLAMAGLLTVALLAGMALFDALATPDNRIMLPAGIVTLCALVWSVDVAVQRVWVPALALGAWVLLATAPWHAGSTFGSTDRLPVARQFRDLDARVIVTNDADGVYWETGIPSAYLPPPRMSLTDEPVDRAALYQQLPCALERGHGVVIVFEGAFFGVDPQTQSFLDGLVSDGRLVPDSFEGGTIYESSPTACAS